jgi:hypothetical protein
LPFIPTLEVKQVSKARRINVNVAVFWRAMGIEPIAESRSINQIMLIRLPLLP